MIDVLSIEPDDIWYPSVLARIRSIASDDRQDLNVDLLIAMIQAGLAATPSAWRLLAFVDRPHFADLGRLVGHAVMTLQSDGAKRWVLILQTFITPHDDTGDAVRRALQETDRWAQEHQAKFYTMVTTRETDAWTRKFGFLKVGTLYRRPVPALAPA